MQLNNSEAKSWGNGWALAMVMMSGMMEIMPLPPRGQPADKA